MGSAEGAHRREELRIGQVMLIHDDRADAAAGVRADG